MKPLVMKYTTPAPDSVEGWERYSLPLGCGHFGANVFGIVQRERIQITDNSVLTRHNLTNAAEIYFHFPHKEISDYERGLCLDNAIAHCRYTSGGVHYTREYFTSYPDKVLAVRLTADRDGALSFTLAPEIPFLHPFGNDDDYGAKGKRAVIRAHGQKIEIDCELEYYGILYSARMYIETDGSVHADGQILRVDKASEAVILFSCGTNYELSARAFSESDPRKKLDPVDPGERVEGALKAAVQKGYAALKAAHEGDYCSLFGRVSLELGAPRDSDDLPTDVLLKRYADGEPSSYLETLYYQYGRYLLIGSSRAGCLPANLQGIWNCHENSPWGSGYWHNINVQMNYWPVFATNLADLFPPYVDLNEAFREKHSEYAEEYIRRHNPENYREGEDYGWCVGTAVRPYEPSLLPGGHSGPGTGGLTTKMFWDYWDFTRDESVLRKHVFPALISMSRFLTRTVRDYDGSYLASFSASPEQMLNGRYIGNGAYYHTVGCAFDQQMIYENAKDTLAAADVLGESDSTTERLKKQIDNYAPIAIGWSGQIKEYQEENYYGEIGEYNHRHISQLVALSPGTLITGDTPAWIDAAKVTLNERSDDSTGWALAHRLNAWARTGDGDRSHNLLRNLLGTRTLPNLWDTHPPFQIDGNFGATAGITEMLLQSHEGFVHLLPSLPAAWPDGDVHGLVARGNFIVSFRWRKGQIVHAEIMANQGGRLCAHYPNIASATVRAENGGTPRVEILSSDRIAFETKAGLSYTFKAIPEYTRISPPASLKVDRKTLKLAWEASAEDGVRYNVYRNTGSAPTYEKLADGIDCLSFTDETIDFTEEDYVTYKVTAARSDGSDESDGLTRTICHSTRLYRERYLRQIYTTSLAAKSIDDL